MVFGAILAVALPPARAPLLRSAGRALVSDAPLERADVIVLGVASDGAGALEAADLVHAGLASRVALVREPAGPVVAEFSRRGASYEDEAERSARELRTLGVTNVDVIPGVVAGTEDESRLIPLWCETSHLHSAIVVTTSDHSRRLGRALRRTDADGAVRVVVRGARLSSFDPDHWWQSRGGIRIEIIEMQKLIFDLLRHPLS
jgi:hypothetical protein